MLEPDIATRLSMSDRSSLGIFSLAAIVRRCTVLLFSHETWVLRMFMFRLDLSLRP